MLAVSPLAAMRSAPTTTAAISPRERKCPAMLSVMSSTGIPSRASSQAVRRAPWRKGRVSSARTRIALPGLDRAADDAERRAVAGRGERARVAVREHGRPGREQLGAEAPDAPARGDVLGRDRVGFGDEGGLDRFRGLAAARGEAARHPVERREEVHGRRARRGEQAPRGLEALGGRRRSAAAQRERGAVGRGDADGRGARARPCRGSRSRSSGAARARARLRARAGASDRVAEGCAPRGKRGPRTSAPKVRGPGARRGRRRCGEGRRRLRLPSGFRRDRVDAPESSGDRSIAFHDRPVAHRLEGCGPGGVETLALDFQNVGKVLLVEARRGDGRVQRLAPQGSPSRT